MNMKNKEPDKFNRYGGDDGKHDPDELCRIRFSNCLSYLITILECYECIGAVQEGNQPIYCDPEVFTVEKALEDFYDLDQTLQDASELAFALPQSKELKQIQVALYMIDLEQMDVPAESAMLDGKEEIAVELLQSKVREIYENVGYRLRQLVAEYTLSEDLATEAKGKQTSDEPGEPKRKRPELMKATKVVLDKTPELWEKDNREDLIKRVNEQLELWGQGRIANRANVRNSLSQLRKGK